MDFAENYNLRGTKLQMIEYILVVLKFAKPVFVTRDIHRLMDFLRIREKYEMEELLYKIEVHFEIPFKDVTIFKVPIHDNLPFSAQYPKNFPVE